MSNGDDKFQTVAFCDERHNSVNGRFKSIEERLKSMDQRMWGMVLLGIAQLSALVGILIRG
ncbi:MAG TPA: hypothetical protein VMX74_13455 [Pirellulales bacterium]|nr:hypothetical protein [Pirellulales bacterium]